MKHKKIIALVLTGLLVIGIFAAGCASSEGGLKSFSAVTLDGGSFSQKEIQEKDLTVMNFWGTFCGPCIAEMPDLAAFAKALPENVGFVTVCVDAASNPEGAKTLLQQSGYEGITLIRGDGDLAALLNEIQVVPTTIFVDTKGNLVGEPIQGGGFSNLSSVFLAAVNQALKESGKAEIHLEN